MKSWTQVVLNGEAIQYRELMLSLDIFCLKKLSYEWITVKVMIFIGLWIAPK